MAFPSRGAQKSAEESDTSVDIVINNSPKERSARTIAWILFYVKWWIFEKKGGRLTSSQLLRRVINRGGRRPKNWIREENDRYISAKNTLKEVAS